MWTNSSLYLQPRLLCQRRVWHLVQELHGRGYSLASPSSSEELPKTPDHWLSYSNCLDDSSRREFSKHLIRQMKPCDDFGFLSTKLAYTAISQQRNQSVIAEENHSLYAEIPTTVDPSELGGSTESVDTEQMEGLLINGNEIETSREIMEKERSLSSDEFLLGSSFREVNSSNEYKWLFSQSVPLKVERFGPSKHRLIKATAEEIITALENEDLTLLRSILMEKKWPSHRAIGPQLDQLFDFIIRESIDTGEAVVFIQDFAACNHRGYLHDVIGVRLALRVAHESNSVTEALEVLRMFRSVFVVRSPAQPRAKYSAMVAEEFYDALFHIGSKAEVEDASKLMVVLGFERNFASFIRAYTNFVIKSSCDIYEAYDQWFQICARHGVMHGSELMWEELFTKVSDPVEQARLADQLLAHSRLYDHPFAAVSNLIIALVRLNDLASAKAVFSRVAVPGRFFKRSFSLMVRSKDSLAVIERFALLMSECMFSEKRYSLSTRLPAASTFLASQLASVLDTFFGVSSRKKAARKERKRKFHRINDEHLYDLAALVQNTWLERAEMTNDLPAVDRLVAWSCSNRIDIPPNASQRISSLKGKINAQKFRIS